MTSPCRRSDDRENQTCESHDHDNRKLTNCLPGRAALAALCALLVGACADAGPVGPGAQPPDPSGEARQTTAVDSAVIGDGVFTTRLGEPFVNQFGFTNTPMALHFRNAGTEPLVGKFHMTPGCAYWPRLYWTSARSLDAAWDPSRQDLVACTLQSTDFEIEVGGEGQVQLGAFNAGVLGDSLPDGWYHPTVTIAPFGVFAELKVDSVLLVRP